jgi:hypothetical protein
MFYIVYFYLFCEVLSISRLYSIILSMVGRFYVLNWEGCCTGYIPKQNLSRSESGIGLNIS